MASTDSRRVKETVQKIDRLRKRVAALRRKGTLTVELDDTYERDIILKALELLRETVHTSSLRPPLS